MSFRSNILQNNSLLTPLLLHLKKKQQSKTKRKNPNKCNSYYISLIAKSSVKSELATLLKKYCIDNYNSYVINKLQVILKYNCTKQVYLHT